MDGRRYNNAGAIVEEGQSERLKSMILGWESGGSRVGVARPEGSLNK